MAGFRRRNALPAIALVVIVSGTAWVVARASEKGTVGGIQPVQDVTSIVNEKLGLKASTVVTLDLPAPVRAPVRINVPIEGRSTTFDLSPNSVRAANFKLLAQVEDGSLVEVDPGPPRTYRGTIAEFPGSVVAGSLRDDGLYARVILADGEEYWVEPIARHVGGAGARHVVYRKGDATCEAGACANDTGAIRVPDAPIGAVPQPRDTGTLAAVNNSVAQLANDADFEYYQDHGSSVTQVQNDIAAITNTMNIQYERDVQITHVITTTIVRTAEPDPYTQTSNEGLINEFRNEWNTNQAGVTRDVAQLFTGKEIDGSVIGRAFDLGTVCNLSDAYCFVQSDFNSNMSCKTDLSAHELGHCWNAFHCSCGFPNSFTMNASITCANVFNPVDSIPTIVGWRSIETCDTGGDPPPANDTCSNATEACVGTFNGSTDSAGNSATGSCIGADTGAPDVWYSYTPNANGTLTVDTCGTVYDTTLSIYDSCGGTELICNDDSNACGSNSRQSSVSVSVSAGVTYYIRVFGWRKQAGDFTLNISGPDCGVSACNDNGNCEPGEDCNNCPNDCRSKTNGNPSSRYCCDGDLPDCGAPQCNEGGFSCSQPCGSDPECDDGDPCNGAETCVSGTCQPGTPPPCQNGDGCCPSGCTPANDDDCEACGLNKDPCTVNEDCCSLNCKNGSCKGN